MPRGRQLLLACSLLVALLSSRCVRVESTPLDDYVNKPDPTYKYEDLGNPFKGEGYTSYFINLTSQTWLSANIVSQSVWWHFLVINIPDKIEFTDSAFIYITGGDNKPGAKVPDITSADCLFSTVTAFSTGTVTATLFQIPNQPLLFSEDTLQKHRTEDAAIAYTWYHYFYHQDQPEYILRLPMTKAVVRAMDTMTDFAAKKVPSLNITKFVVAGASKRGWTTWTTGIVDKRVIGIVPIVEDLLNINPNMHHHYRSLGGWTFAFDDYMDLNITAYVDDPRMKNLANIVDPYSYLDRLTMPKFLINSGGDEFFLPDDNHYFWNDLQGEKFLRVLPNAEHSCAGHFTSLILGFRAFYLSLLMNKPRPKMTWKMDSTVDGGSITLMTDTKPLTVQVWHATTIQSKRRDFRLLTGEPDPHNPTPQPVLWFAKDLQPQDDGTYIANVSVPDQGWRAFMLQVTFPGPRSDTVFEFTTQVNIVPDVFPFPDCHGQECLGTLV